MRGKCYRRRRPYRYLGMGPESRRYRRSFTGKSAAPVNALAIPNSQNTEANHEAEISKGVGPVADIRDVDSDRGTADNCARVAESAKIVHPVPRLSLVNPVPHGSTKLRASGSTLRKRTGSTPKVHPVPRNGKPPTFTGYKWKPSGLTGWELYTRKPSVSISGKRSSTGKYLGYYSQEAVRILYAATQKTPNARRA